MYTPSSITKSQSSDLRATLGVNMALILVASQPLLGLLGDSKLSHQFSADAVA